MGRAALHYSPHVSHGFAIMSNTRAKPDSGITMDDVDGFSAVELFGQGTL